MTDVEIVNWIFIIFAGVPMGIFAWGLIIIALIKIYSKEW